MIARTPFQELPLLPGEYEFLDSKGWLLQFGDYDHKVTKFEIDDYSLCVFFLSSLCYQMSVLLCTLRTIGGINGVIILFSEFTSY